MHWVIAIYLLIAGVVCLSVLYMGGVIGKSRNESNWEDTPIGKGRTKKGDKKSDSHESGSSGSCEKRS